MEIYNTTSSFVEGTAGDDFIVNYVEGALVYGEDGNDYMVNASNDCWLRGEDGNDTLVSYAVNGHDIDLRDGNGSDLIADFGSGMATIDGSSFDEADDIFISGDGVDVFEIASWGGNDIIVNYKPYDVIFSYNSYSDWSYQIVGTDALLTNVFGGSVYIQNGGAGINFFTYEDSYDAFKELIGNYKAILGISDYAYDTATDDVWGNANQYFGTTAADNIFIGKSDGNDFVFDTAANDTVHFYDATLSDIVSTSVTDSAIEITFDTGDITRVVTSDDVSPTFKFTSGESYVYNRTAASWQTV